MTELPGDGLTVILTGAARGLGREMTLALALAGFRIVATDLADSDDEMAALVRLAEADGTAARVVPMFGDTRVLEDGRRIVAETVRRFGAVHGLVNNAALGPQEVGLMRNGKRRRFDEIDPAVWLRTTDTNLNGPFLMAHAVTPHLLAQGWGRIVNIVTSTTTMQNQGNSPYGPTKAAMEAATVVWSRDLAETGVTVNALLPGGAANTRMIPVEDHPDRAALNQPVVMRAPIVWLMSRASDGVTGHRFIGKFWDPSAPVDVAVAAAGSLAGWR
jgi:3-oxoacyl-[acyl-carrier protein] reductase